MEDDGTGTTNGSVQKLTIGQRILASLPNLERQKTARSRAVESSKGPAEAENSSSKRASSGNTDEVIEAEEVTSPSPTRASAYARPNRLRDAFLKPPASGQAARRADPTAEMSNEEIANAIKRIDDRERLYALWAGPVGAVIGVLLTIAAIHYNPPLHHRGHVANSLTELYGVARVVLGGLVVLTALSRRRSLVAFSLLFLGTAVGFPLALVFWGLGGWMIWRVFRFQKALTARGVGPQRGRASAGPRPAARAGASDARERAIARRAAARERRQRGRRKQPEPTGPPPSKRYTPPKPTRPRPPAASS